MNNRLVRTVGAILICALAACAGTPFGAKEITKSTKAGTEVELASWAYWDDNCEAEAFDIAVDTKPANGRIYVRDDVYAIPKVTANGTKTGCVDKIIESKKVFYVPNDGFVGQDSAVLTFSGSSGATTNAYAVTVR